MISILGKCNPCQHHATRNNQRRWFSVNRLCTPRYTDFPMTIYKTSVHFITKMFGRWNENRINAMSLARLRTWIFAGKHCCGFLPALLCSAFSFERFDGKVDSTRKSQLKQQAHTQQKQNCILCRPISISFPSCIPYALPKSSSSLSCNEASLTVEGSLSVGC